MRGGAGGCRGGEGGAALVGPGAVARAARSDEHAGVVAWAYEVEARLLRGEGRGVSD